jgi:hypothetical protein
MPTSQLSTNQLRQALQLSEQIESLQQRLNSILGGPSTTSSPAKSTAGGSSLRGRKLSSATLRKMRAAQQARWAKIRGSDAAEPSQGAGASKSPASTQKKKSSGMTPEQRAKIAATMKARWAAKKKNEAALTVRAGEK